jgi:hypothetical protein
MTPFTRFPRRPARGGIGGLVRAWLLAALLACGAAPAYADTLDSLINIASIVLGEPALKDARPLIECVKDKGPAACLDVTEEVAAQGKQAAKQFMPDDPRILTAVEIVKAAYAKDLFKVLELVGVEFLPQIACDLGLAATGPAKTLVCGPVFKKVAGLAKPVLAQVLETVQHPSVGNLLELVTVVELDLACDILPSFPGKDEICGPLGQVAQLTKDAVVAAGKAGLAAGEFLINAGKQIIAGIGSGFESACKALTLCDDGGAKLMAPAEYYKYVLFPRIHDRVLARLVNGQQNLGHDAASQQACLKYYMYDLYAKMAPAVTPQIKKACDDLGARLHKEADVIARALAAAPTPYFESAARPLVPTMAVEGFGKDKLPGFRKFVEQICVTNLRGRILMVEPTKPATGWDWACSKVGAQFQVAYQAQEKHLKGELTKLALYGACKVPAGWSVPAKGVKLECGSYTGYQYCLKTLAPGKEKDRCSVNAAAADKKLAADIVAKLGAKRCHPGAGGVACSRPWKVASCKAMVAAVVAPQGMQPAVKCAADLAGFAVLETKAKGVIASLNGVHPAGGTVGADGRKHGLAVVTPGGGAHCAHTWDPLAIRCDDTKAWKTEVAANASLQLPHCAVDTAHDGADTPCYSMPVQPGGGNAPIVAKPATGTLPTGSAAPAGSGARLAHTAPVNAAAAPVAETPRPPQTTTLVAPRVMLAPPAVPAAPAAAARAGSPLSGNAGRAEFETERALAAAGCARSATDESRFTCRTPAGLARCEDLRRQGRVQSCALNGRG